MNYFFKSLVMLSKYFQISKGGWVKLPQRNNSNWEKKYIQLVGCDIQVFESKPTEKSEPVSTIQLKQNNGCTVVTPEVCTKF